ncbi:class B sortase [Ruminococcus sp.]|uniref:class B sortase n=1 Tax=Ruminococcus sp. TaxID=41978 RepID=UPI00388D5E72
MKKKKIIWIIVLVFCLLIVVAGVIFMLNPFADSDIKRADFTPTQAETVPETAAAATETVAETAAETVVAGDFGFKLAELGDFNVDFDELQSVNKDIYAWIYIPNTKVDYPVVRNITDGDDTFYLEHNIYRQYQFSGTIFSELQNHPDFHDPVTVLYGHNMLNGSMFATLHDFENPDFFAKNNTAFILTKDKVYTYLIYSAYTFDDRHILNSNFFNSKESFRAYLESTLHPYSLDANVREGVELTTDNRILVLSTCTNGAANTRYLVQGVLANEQER